MLALAGYRNCGFVLTCMSPELNVPIRIEGFHCSGKNNISVRDNLIFVNYKKDARMAWSLHDDVTSKSLEAVVEIIGRLWR